jgi:hypothetical protein
MDSFCRPEKTIQSFPEHRPVVAIAVRQALSQIFAKKAARSERGARRPDYLDSLRFECRPDARTVCQGPL